MTAYSTPRRCSSQSPLEGQTHCRQRAASALACAGERPFSTWSKPAARLATGVVGILTRGAAGAATPILSHTGEVSTSLRPTPESLSASCNCSR